MKREGFQHCYMVLMASQVGEKKSNGSNVTIQLSAGEEPVTQAHIQQTEGVPFWAWREGEKERRREVSVSWEEVTELQSLLNFPTPLMGPRRVVAPRVADGTNRVGQYLSTHQTNKQADNKWKEKHKRSLRADVVWGIMADQWQKLLSAGWQTWSSVHVSSVEMSAPAAMRGIKVLLGCHSRDLLWEPAQQSFLMWECH